MGVFLGGGEVPSKANVKAQFLKEIPSTILSKVPRNISTGYRNNAAG